MAASVSSSVLYQPKLKRTALEALAAGEGLEVEGFYELTL